MFLIVVAVIVVIVIVVIVVVGGVLLLIVVVVGRLEGMLAILVGDEFLLESLMVSSFFRHDTHSIFSYG